MTQPHNAPQIPQRIAIVGTGPTGLYAFDSLVKSDVPATFDLFERGDRAGVGMPYSAESSSRVMLANIASIEIPPLFSPYLDWLRTLPQAHLDRFSLNHAALHDRLFTPRVLLGDYFHAQLAQLCDRAVGAGSQVQVHENTQITDVVLSEGQIFLLGSDSARLGPFDHVILATGHDFPDADEATKQYFPSPWSGLIHAQVPAVAVGIMGTSLSSIDAALAVVNQHGSFRQDGEDLAFDCTSDDLHITLMSWTGVLPEADFYCPIPYQPLQIMTEERVAACAQHDAPLDAMFELFSKELALADPDYAGQIDLASRTADTFADAYFARRLKHDPFQWARKNLAEVERNKANKITVQWRYALLRMHEQFETIVPDLNEADRERFDAGLKTVFTDNYAAVPSESIRRLLALRDAGVLSVLALGEDYTLDKKPDCTVINAKGTEHVFSVFIDARGQKPLTTQDIPFPSLRSALLATSKDIPEVDDRYRLVGVEGYADRVTFAALPWLIRDRPFVQGITASAEMGKSIGEALLTPAA